MRRHLYAGAVAAGFLLLGAAPAYADVQPAPADAQQDAGDPGGLLGSTNGIDLSNPLGGTSLLNVNPGDNSVLPPQDDVPPARTGFGRAGAQRDSSGPAERPVAAEKVDALPVPDRGLPTGALSQLPIASLLGGGLPVIGGLLPNGQSPLGSRADQESGLLDDGVPLLGGLGGLLPGHSARTLPAASGMPAGGTAVPAGEPAQDVPDGTKPAQPDPKPAAADPAIADDHRLHEEPTDPEDKSDSRPFSGGRPIAGVDPDFS
jgi:hypothetical protein